MTAATARTRVLTEAQVKQKIRRMAFEICEGNFSEKSLVIAGIEGQGYELAVRLMAELKKIMPAKVECVRIAIDKAAPQRSDIRLEADEKTLGKKVIIVVDDVLNSGRTLAYALRPFLKIEVKKIEVAVLVNRSLPKFPIEPRYTGYELSTTLEDHVEVVLGKTSGVYVH
jgi:pyrimidine operon attenuation protein/uracil phosphoribosyltransferase